ncbi:MAG: hypothetical protein AAFR14_12615, partial [Bacteroidota bacterium]
FTPSDPFQFDKDYKVVIDLDKVASDQRNEKVVLHFETRPLFMSIEIDQPDIFVAADEVITYVEGQIQTNDFVDPSIVQSVVKASIGKEDLTLEWIHTDDGRFHDFKTPNRKQTDKAYEVDITWNGGNLAPSFKGSTSVQVLSANDFLIIDTYIERQGSQHIVAKLSQPLDPQQSLDGLIKVGGQSASPRLLINGNTIRIYPKVRIQGKADVSFSKIYDPTLRHI